MGTHSYSVHDVDSGVGKPGKGWVLIREEMDEHGDVVDTEEVRFYRTEAAALRGLERMRASQREDEAPQE